MFTYNYHNITIIYVEFRHEHKACPNCHWPKEVRRFSPDFSTSRYEKCCTDDMIGKGNATSPVKCKAEPGCESWQFQEDPVTALNAGN